ncbi:nucleoside triphosphate pyrophosphohydrolase [Geobacillus sp. NFOSA3]|uniref:MazG family protein n=2 Tax=Anoxybacillaceae TaxID=3120669 RepID=A0A226QNL9_9BACL|nr:MULTISPECIES: nucleoside triphosphate pyrophosphohydrolase [Parageobacillus]NNU93857.1 nucleoside triphosphate pyrophosphohydrolase [Geobacillus sp. NFOSA3]OQP00420.1 MazG family protein [Geobacillus sp. 44C]MED4988372.1 nucleoside triphosphate pyrophosphohydrolase [Parageobacillus toebii]OXB93458.1 MazG family protein [Parageobacillus galactosidasius]QNU35902.1 nucleoside triphosphate pyrophosphohydrolase [Geobacillus sp. 44C]
MNAIYIFGLGAGDIEQLPLGVYRKLKTASPLFFRTKEHPVVAALEDEGVSFTSFDSIYEKHEQFEDVYEEITAILLEQVKERDIFYAVPGHPLVAEKTVQLLLEAERRKECRVVIEGGQSFLDALFTTLKIDPIEGFQLIDATSFQGDEWQLTKHTIFCQVYDSFIASEVKLTLMEQLPDDYPVYIVTAAGSKEEKVTKIPLYELDRSTTLNNLTSVYVPPVREEKLLYHRFETLRRVIATLRGPNGCPWDRKQTHESLKRYLLEETYELFEAIDENDDEHMIEELGDVLLQVMLHAQIGEDEGMFSIDDVIRGITEKMIRRHPHVFGDIIVENAEQVVENWQRIKEKEKKDRSNSLLDDVPKSLPNILKAYEFQKKAAKVGFDWDDVKPMWEKVEEEIAEFKRETLAERNTRSRLISEFGDILFALINIARYYDINPEEALHSTNKKFYQRFSYIEEQAQKHGVALTSLSLAELDRFWEEAKEKGW